MLSDIPLIYEDNHLLCLLKPAGMLSQGDASGHPDLLSYGKAYIKEKYHKSGAVYLGLVHRLDRATSGPMVFARTSKAAARLSAQFRDRLIKKLYHAIVIGYPDPDSGTMRDLMRKDNQNNKAVVARPSDREAKEALLSYRVLKTCETEKRSFNNLYAPEANDGDWKPHAQQKKHAITLIEIELHTGRFHQIRFQCSQRNHPLLGDRKYGSTFELRKRGLALECVALSFEHPVKKELIHLQGLRHLETLFP